jgi:hypothetical protein
VSWAFSLLSLKVVAKSEPDANNTVKVPLLKSKIFASFYSQIFHQSSYVFCDRRDSPTQKSSGPAFGM